MKKIELQLIQYVPLATDPGISLIILPLKLNSVALVRERTIPTERPPPVGEVSADFFADKGVSRG